MASHIDQWLNGYLRAWQSNRANDIRALFTEDAEYRTEPWVQPWRGVDAIVDGWLERQDLPGTAEFTWSVIAETDAVTVVEGKTTYRDGPTYSNLWVISFDANGRARSFTEWWMDQSS
ncbi:nuclear transport factor 2 family protein [Mycetocola zhadangensis]|uniref:SnoaL-like domain-containing protein n=1 Tax=Mycetocola zhadangensis TaxID=1164595 RepID=A0A3L7JCV5_9MICO|nr:nuclear transport factor 2 family protein [Mycetocola zhadangensis]RLQ86322.1 hypothetical protein D9V28_05735 [Mycetocola zhadangensis]GGE90164.1 hypothetical protein GCM10011313_11320 [Mycetocola zhadangensis]